MLGANPFHARRDARLNIEFERELARMKKYDIDYYSMKTIQEMNNEFPSVIFSLMFYTTI